jgi:hypothetical protein
MDRFEAEVAEFVFDDDVDEANRWEGDYGLSDSDEPEERGFNPDQPRDDHGRWSSTGGGGTERSQEVPDSGSGFELGKYPPSQELDVPAAKTRFDHLNAQADRHQIESHDHKKLAEKEPDLLKKQEHYRNARAADARHTLTRYDAMTYRQANDAADKAGYLRGRQEVAEAMKAKYEADEALTQKMLADGVRPKGDESWRMELTPQSIRSAGAYTYSDDKDKQFESAKKEIPGLQREHFDEAMAGSHASFMASDMRAQYERPYYGEPEHVTMASKELGPVDAAAMPANVERGGGPQAVRDYMANGKIAIALKDKPLDRIISNGEFKNRFEGGISGVNSAKGRQYKEARIEAENEVFGIPHDADGSARPAYGYIEHPDRLTSSGARHGSNYGPNQIVLKDDLKSRATFTVGDSIDDRRIRDNAKPSPINDPHLPAAIDEKDHVFYAGRTNEEWKIDAIGSGLGYQKPQYIEAQVFGKIKLEDIAEIRIPRGRELKPAQEKKLAKAGVKIVRVPPAVQSSFYSKPKDWDNAFKDDED